MLWRACGSPGMSADLSAYTDKDMIAAYASDAFEWAVKTGIIEGKSGDMLDPAGKLTRAEMAQILMRYLKTTEAA